MTQTNSLILEIKNTFPDFFTLILLPPIIYESAINTTRPFYKNFGSILLYAVLGTLIAAIFTSSII